MLSIWFQSRHAVKPGGTRAPAVLSLAQFPEPFVSEFETDAHFWPYVCYKASKPHHIQISVPVRSKKPKQISPDEAVLCHYLVLEWDKAGHGQLSSSDQDHLTETLRNIDPDSPTARVGVFYWTRGGARFVYRLSRPVDYSRYEGLVRGLQHDLFRQTGLQCDPTSDQWWRCYRLPKVVRSDGKDEGRTWEKSWFDLHLLDPELDPDTVTPRTDQVPWDQRGAAAAAFASDEVPDRDRALSLITPAFKTEAKKLLKKAGCFPFVFDGLEPPPGTRDSAMLKFPGQAVARMFGKIEYLTAEHIYGLLLPTIDGIETDGEPLSKKLWRTTQHAWNSEAEKASEKDIEILNVADERDRFLDRVLANFEEGSLPDDPFERKKFAMQHLICVNGLSNYVVQSDGSYNSRPVRLGQVPAALRDAMPWFQGFYGEKSGQIRPLNHLLADYSSNISRVMLVPAREKGLKVVQENGDWIMNITPYSVRKDVLQHAALDPDITEYLKACGPRAYREMTKWFSNALAVWEGNTCALSLCGIKSTGKSMVALALADCFGGSVCHATIAFQRFNSPLMYTPVVLADEGLPVKIEGVPVPDLFRSFVTGVGYSVEFKGMEPIVSRVGIRMIMCANNHELLRTLAGGRIMSRDDTEAIAERIMHVRIEDTAAHFLSARGHHAFTSHDPKGPWIGGDPAQGGMRFARHIAALHFAAREDETDLTRFQRRLLTEGELEPKVIAMLENSGLTPEIAGQVASDVEALLEDKTPALSQMLRIERGSLYYRKRLYVQRVSDSLRAKPAQVRRILDRWCSGYELQLPYAPNSPRRTLWWELKTNEIEEVARLEGIDAHAISQLNNEVLK